MKMKFYKVISISIIICILATWPHNVSALSLIQNNSSNINGVDEYNSDKQKSVEHSQMSLRASITVNLISLAVVYYNTTKRAREEAEKILKQTGYGAKDMKDFEKNYLTLGKYKGLDYEITQKMWDDAIAEDTQNYSSVNRAAKDGDQIIFDVIGYVNGKKEKNLLFEEQEIIVGDTTDGVFRNVPELIIGKKGGDYLKDIEGLDIKEISDSPKKYKEKKVTFDIKIRDVSELVVDEVTDQWVEENFEDEYGWTTKEEYYDNIKSELMDEAKINLWNKVIAESTVKKYPDDVYSRIVDEVDADTNFTADEWGMTLQEYYDTFAITDEDLDKQYEEELASEMIAWAIAIKERLAKISDEEMEASWKSMYEELGYESIEEMKADRDEMEIVRAIILERSSSYVRNHANIKINYKIAS